VFNLGNFTTTGFTCGYSKPRDINDGTNPRAAMATPSRVCWEQSWSVQDYWRRLGFVREAWTKCQNSYANEAIIKQVGEDAFTILSGILIGLLMALGVLIVTVGLGAVVGGAIGFFGGGVGALPGAVAGADVGLTIGNGILAWAGLGFLLVYIGGHLGEMWEHFRSAIDTAWRSNGNAAMIDAAAHEFAAGVGFFVSLLLQGLVLYLTKGASKQGAAKALGELRASLLFKHCPRLEPWLIKNYPKLRAKYVPLTWTVLEESPTKFPNTSIPEWMRLKVGEREFYVYRDPLKPGYKSGVPKGYTTKHLAEIAQNASDWAKLSQTDFPISSLAGALDQAEAQLIFQPPSPSAKPIGLEDWELVIDTTQPVWRVEHAAYKSNPLW
jgi:hypothetical protein